MASGAAATSVLTAAGEILNPGQKSILVEKPMVDRDVETAARLGIEEAIKAIAFSQDSPLAMRTNGQPN